MGWAQQPRARMGDEALPEPQKKEPKPKACGAISTPLDQLLCRVSTDDARLGNGATNILDRYVPQQV